jgi:hypothetical protein
MNGPQHYSRAEELLSWIKGRPQSPSTDNGGPLTLQATAVLIARADAHIRLAGIAALVATRGGGMTNDDEARWAVALDPERSSRG